MAGCPNMIDTLLQMHVTPYSKLHHCTIERCMHCSTFSLLCYGLCTAEGLPCNMGCASAMCRPLSRLGSLMTAV